jgi:hypothetical protein
VTSSDKVITVFFFEEVTFSNNQRKPWTCPMNCNKKVSISMKWLKTEKKILVW